MRILVDYRPALRERTGVGEYVHELVRALTSNPEAAADEVALFTSSWKDRPDPHLARELNARVVDCRIPVSLLNLAWHRLEAPPVELLAGEADVVHGQHPLLIPARRAAQVVTIHDLFFLTSPERTRAEIRRDYARLAPDHARRAHAVITSSHVTAGRIARELGVGADRIYVCPPGAPRWMNLGREPHRTRRGHLLFLGTLEPRKNLGTLLDAYEQLIAACAGAPPLVLAGGRTPEAEAWLARIARAPLSGRVEYRGYVPADERERLYAGASMLVLPSLDEGFGFPALEAMSAGVPVVASTRGSLPEVVGDAGPLVEAMDAGALAVAMRRLLEDDAYAEACAAKGLARAAEFSWPRTAATVRRAYMDAVARRRG